MADFERFPGGILKNNMELKGVTFTFYLKNKTVYDKLYIIKNINICFWEGCRNPLDSPPINQPLPLYLRVGTTILVIIIIIVISRVGPITRVGSRSVYGQYRRNNRAYTRMQYVGTADCGFKVLNCNGFFFCSFFRVGIVKST